MSIEDELRASQTVVDPLHKQRLRESLLTDMKERSMKTQQKRPKLVWTFALVPVMAVAVLMSLTIWQPKTDNVFVRELTAAQVLADAKEKLDLSEPPDGMYRYVKSSRASGASICGRVIEKEFTEFYSLSDTKYREIRSNMRGKIIDIHDWNLEVSPQDQMTTVYSNMDNYIAPPIVMEATEDCANRQMPNTEEYEQIQQMALKIMRAEGSDVTDLNKPTSPVPYMYLIRPTKKSIVIYDILAEIEEWKVEQQVEVDWYSKKVIQLTYKIGEVFSIRLYFDPETKMIVGADNHDAAWGDDTVRILESDVRAMPEEIARYPF